MVGQKAFAEESAEVELLLASLDKLTSQTKKIQASLGRLDVSGRIVKDAIGPIYSNTQQLQITNHNIERINEQIEKLRQPLDAKGREENIIRAGPEKAGLPQYLAALKRVDRALSDLNSSNLRSNQQATSEFLGLLALGITQVQDVFRALLEDDVSTIEPLHYITKNIPFPTLSQDKTTRLAPLASAIESATAQSARFGQKDDNVAGRIYAESRGGYIEQSLRNLSTASLNTAKRRTADASIYRQGTNGIGAYANGIEGMFLAEWENISRVFPQESAGPVMHATCSSTLSSFQSCLKDLNKSIKSRIMFDFPLAYEIIDNITPMAYRLESRTGQLRPVFSDALRPVRETSRSSLAELISETKTRASTVSTLPPDGATIPLASETASRLHALAVYERPVSSLLSSLGDGNWRTNNTSTNSLAASSTLNLELTPSNENPTLFSHYLLDLIDALLNTLDTRSKTLHRTKPVQAIFLLNTHATIQRTVSRTPDLARYLLISPHVAKLDAYRKAGSSAYLAAWREPAGHLLDTITTSGPSKSSAAAGGGARPLSGSAIDSSALVKSLSSKDKDKIKEKFKAFNASFDELVARHKSLAMEMEVRAAVGKDVVSLIEPLYVRFYDRYHEIDKGKGKVVKYDKAAIAGVLGGL